MAKIDRLLKETVDRRASDLHISSNRAPCIRIDGEVRFLSDMPVTTPEDADAMIKEIMPEHNRNELDSTWDTDCGYVLPGVGRFRVNAFKDMNGTGGVFRTIPEKVLTLDDLRIEDTDTLKSLCMHTKGLIIVTGPTGSGKSTTLAAMVDYINRTRNEHIITIEDPIEFVHDSKRCLINQREVHRHTRSFEGALRAALREDPDIVLMGEMRDLETTEIALETAETGHLVLATMHTNTATSTVDRIIDKFPGNRQNQIRTLLANTLTAVIAQTLCKRTDQGRAAALEILIANSAVRSNIRDGKTHQLPTAIQTAYNIGMRSFTDNMSLLVQKGTITSREAYLKAIDKVSLEQKFEKLGIALDKSTTDILVDEDGETLSNEETIKKLKKMAWDLSTSTHNAARCGNKAVELIQKAIHLGSNDAETFMVLAAAQAEGGDFKAALETAKKAMKMANHERNVDCQRELPQQINAYKKKRTLSGPMA